ncbi:MAG: hypothetical protein AB1485_04360, partial [Candidatus Thermoplasmatota archaeon]
MVTISVRVDEELLKEMRKLPHINWSEVVRNALRERAEREKVRDIVRAITVTEKLRKKAKKGW